MAIRTEDEINDFLLEVINLLEEDTLNLYIVPRQKSKDETNEFRIQYNIQHESICDVIKELNIWNYSSTEEDRDSKKGGEVWIFGKMFQVSSGFVEVYIKLKISGRVVCLSFHPAKFKLTYPYLNN